jgi:uncharacterized damage-inducible protein DinB
MREAFTALLTTPAAEPARLLSAKRAQERSTMNIKSCRTAVVTLALTTLLAPAFAATGDVPVHLAAPQASPAQVFGKLISDQGEKIVAVAEAMPADKYNFAPTNGEFKTVNTFSQQLTHLAEAQYYFFGGFGTKPTIDPKSLATLTSKDEIVKALKDAFAFAQQATETITPENAFEKIAERDGTNTRASITAFAMGHTENHYGQMVEYLRMNGIIPPASRK